MAPWRPRGSAGKLLSNGGSMKGLVLACVLLGGSACGNAVAPGAPNCGPGCRGEAANVTWFEGSARKLDLLLVVDPALMEDLEVQARLRGLLQAFTRLPLDLRVGVVSAGAAAEPGELLSGGHRCNLAEPAFLEAPATCGVPANFTGS